MAKSLSISALVPDDTPDYMVPAWISCLCWAAGEEGIVEAFRHDTGNQWRPSSSPIERMIDEATGAEAETIKAFILWANVNVWGPIDGPVDDDVLASAICAGHSRGRRL